MLSIIVLHYNILISFLIINVYHKDTIKYFANNNINNCVVDLIKYQVIPRCLAVLSIKYRLQ